MLEHRIAYLNKHIANCEHLHKQGLMNIIDYQWYIDMQIELKELEGLK